MSLIKMNTSVRVAFFVFATVAPLFCFAQMEEAKGLHFKAELMTIINIILLVASLIAIRQFFWPGDTDYSPFHFINALAIIIFYCAGLYFLVSHRHEYLGYEHLSAMGCVARFFFSPDIDALKQWVIVFGLVINVCYIVRKSRSVI